MPSWARLRARPQVLRADRSACRWVHRPASPAADAQPVQRDGDEPYGLGSQLAALALFIVAGLFLKTWLLNGIAGPLFLVFVLYLLPRWLRRLARIGRAR